MVDVVTKTKTSNTTDLIIPFNYYYPRDYQIEVFKQINQGIKRIMLIWSRQIGKDTTCFCIMVEQALKVPGNYYYLFPELKEAKRAVWHKIDHDGKPLISVIPEQYIITKDKVEMFIKLRCLDGKSSSTIQFIATRNDPDSLRGLTPRGLVSSEHAHQDPEAFKVLAPAIRMNKCWVIYNSTTNGRNHFWRMWSEFKHRRDWYVSFIQTIFPDKEGYRPILSQVELKDAQIESGMSDEEMAQEYGCSWDVGRKGAIYAHLVEKAMVDKRVGQFEYNDYAPVCTLWDLGYNPDATAVWFFQKTGNGYTLINYLEFTECDLNEIISTISQLGYKYDTWYLPHDAKPKLLAAHGRNIKDLIEDMITKYRLGCYTSIINKPNNELDYITALKSIFNMLKFDEIKCERGLKCLMEYRSKYDPRNNIFSKNPIHDWTSHACKALELLAQVDDLEHEDTPQQFINNYHPMG